MKKYSKIGSRAGYPAYRTPATFRYRQYRKVKNEAVRKNGRKRHG